MRGGVETTADGVYDQEILFGTDFTDSTDGILCRKNQRILVFPGPIRLRRIEGSLGQYKTISND